MRFNVEEYRRKVWAVGFWKLNLGNFRVFKWEKDFDPNIHTHLKARVWKRLGISQEYWNPNTVMEISRAMGIPLKLAKSTRGKI